MEEKKSKINQFIFIPPPGLGMEPGIIYAPYVPLMTTEVIMKKKSIMKVREWLRIKKMDLEITFNEFSTKDLVNSRYATKKINSKFYGALTFGEE